MEKIFKLQTKNESALILSTLQDALACLLYTSDAADE